MDSYKIILIQLGFGLDDVEVEVFCTGIRKKFKAEFVCEQLNEEYATEDFYYTVRKEK